MAKYHLIASVLHPDESGWRRETNPNIAVNYDELTTAIYQEQIDLAKQIMLEHFATDSDTIEEHDGWSGDLEIDEDGEGIWLFKRLEQIDKD